MFILKLNNKIYRLLIALCITILYNASLIASANRAIVIPFELINGLTIIEAEVDGIYGRFLLDTGSDGIFIDGIVKETDQSILTLGGTTAIETRSLNEVIVGSFIQNDLEAQIISLEPIEEHLGIDLKGIIGGHVFLPKVVIMDFQKSIITLSDRLTRLDKKMYENQVDIKIQNQIPIATIQIEGKNYNFALDSGSSIHFIDASLLEKLNGITRVNATSTMKCLANKNEHIQNVRINSFSLGDADFKQQLCLPRSFAHVNAGVGANLHGIISLSQLSKEVVVIDYARGKMWF